MNLDDKIKQALAEDNQEVALLLDTDKGMYDRIFDVFRGNMRFWNMFALLLSLVTAALMFWSGYHFFISESIDDRLFWGVFLIVFWSGTMGLKIWFWLEMNRHATSREIKRLELAVAQLTSKLSNPEP